MDNLTAAQLADKLFELTGKSLKPSSYSKAKFIAMIEAATPSEEVADNSPTPGYEVCPHCGINHLDNGYQDHDSLVGDGLPGLTTNQYVCLACNGEFGPELEEEFTMTEAAAAAGVTPKAARARYRAAFNDGKRTFYKFPRSDWDQVIATISPKRKK